MASVQWVVEDADGVQFRFDSEAEAKENTLRGESYGVVIRGEYIQVSRDYAAEWARRKELGTARNGLWYARQRKAQQRQLQSV